MQGDGVIVAVVLHVVRDDAAGGQRLCGEDLREALLHGAAVTGAVGGAGRDGKQRGGCGAVAVNECLREGLRSLCRVFVGGVRQRGRAEGEKEQVFFSWRVLRLWG